MVLLFLVLLVEGIHHFIIKYLGENEQRTQRLVELAHGTMEQSVRSWGAVLCTALQQCLPWAVAGSLVLLVALCWWLKIRKVGNRYSEKEGSEEENPAHRNMVLSFTRRFHLEAPKLASRRRVVEELLRDLLQVSPDFFSNSFPPVLEPAIGVGSAWEGWSHQKEENVVYCMFVPLMPPHGHAFHLEPDTMGQMPPRSMRIRVELVCTCTAKEHDQHDQNTLCFLHHTEEELKKNQATSLLHTLCTGPYLDTKKIAVWFQKFVTSAWSAVPQSHHYTMKMLPSSRSCKMNLMEASGRKFLVEIIFGVQQGDSDIFLSSQATEAQRLLNTTWLESYAVAEAKFFKHIARQVPHPSCHLKCLRLCARLLDGTGCSTYALKTAVMHLLTLLPLSEWQDRYFTLRVDDILRYLRCCLEEKQLKHFFIGNKDMPEEICLPPALQEAQPLNLFQHLAHDPAAQTDVMREFNRKEYYLHFGFGKKRLRSQ